MKRSVTWIVLIVCGLALLPPRAVDAEPKTLRIAMVLWRGETPAERGFKEGLHDLGYTVHYTVFNAEQDRNRLSRLVRQELPPQLDTFDYVYSFGTTVSNRIKEALKHQVPQLFNVVADPVGSGLVTDLRATGENISGATNQIPLKLQLTTAQRLIRFQRLGLLFNPREQNSMLVRQHLYELASELHFEVVDLRSPPALDLLEKNLQQLVDHSVAVDAVYLPTDSFMISQAALIGQQLRAAGLQSIGSIRTYIELGALVGVVPDYAELGRGVAAIVDRHQRGEPLRNIPVYVTQTPVLVINETTSKAFGLAIPDALRAKALLVK
jgi:putative ABC transport system substrate-binding protein